MAHVILNEVEELTLTPGTGPFVLKGSVGGLGTFGAAMQDGDTTDVCVYDGMAGVRVIGLGTYSAANNSLAVVVQSSTSGNQPISFAGNPGTTISAVLSSNTVNDLIAGRIAGIANATETAGVIQYTDVASGQVYTIQAQAQQIITGLALSNENFLLNLATGATIGTLSVQGSGLTGTPSYTIVSDSSNGGFAISGANFNLAAAVAAGQYTVQVQAAVPGATNSPFSATFVLTAVAYSKITDIGITNNTVAAGQSGATIGNLSVVGLGSPSASNYTLGGTNAADFTLTSTFALQTAIALAAGTYSVDVTAYPTSPNIPTPTAQAGQIVTPYGTGPDLFLFEITQDFYQDDAQFTIQIDSNQVSPVFTATALNGSPVPDIFAIRGTFGPAAHNATITLINYNNSGTASAPANLRTITLVSASYNGVPQGVSDAIFTSGSPATYAFAATTYTKTVQITAQSAEKITGISASNTTFQAGQPAGTVIGTLSLQGTGLSGTPVYTIDNTKFPNFTISGGNQLVTAVANLTAGGIYAPTVVATLAGASNSPFSQTIPLTCYAAAGTTTQQIAGLTLTDLNGNVLSTIEAGTAQNTQVGVLQANGASGPLADPITYALASQSGPVAGAFKVTNYRELLVASTTLPAGTYNVTISVTCAAGANSPQNYPFTITVAAAGTITLNAVASSVVRGEQMLLSGTYTGPQPVFVGYAHSTDKETAYLPCYNLVLDSPSAGDWSAVCPAPTLVNASNTTTVCKGTTGITSAASNSFATTDYDATLRLYFYPHAITAGPNKPYYQQPFGNFYASGGNGPYRFSATVDNGGTYTVNGLMMVATIPGARLSGNVNPTLTLTVTDANGATVSRPYTLVLSPFATFALGQYNAFFGPYAKNGTTPLLFITTSNPLYSSTSLGAISDTSNGPNFTGQWGYGPWGDGFYFDANNTTAYGDYPLVTTATTSNGAFTVLAPVRLVGLEDVTGFGFEFAPAGGINTATPTGYSIGSVRAGSLSNSSRYWIEDNQYLLANVDTGNVTIMKPLPAGTLNFTVKSLTNTVSVSQALSLSVGTGNILPASNMTGVVATNLSNFMASVYPGGVNGLGNGGFAGFNGINGAGTYPQLIPAVTPTVSGMTGTVQWTLHQNNVAAYGPNAAGTRQQASWGADVMAYRYVIDKTTGIVSASGYLCAQTDVLTITAYDGTNACTQTFNVIVSSVSGPTFHVGQGMSTQYSSGGYEHLADCRAGFTGSYGGQIFSGQTILIYPNSNIDYYANDCGNGKAPYTSNNNYDLGHGMQGVATWQGVTGGAMPRMGGQYGLYYEDNGIAPDDKGFFNFSSGQMSFENLAMSYCTGVVWQASWPTVQAQTDLAAIAINSGCPGNVTVSNCSFEACDMAVHSGDSNQNLTLSNIYCFNGAGLWNGSGPMHNFYIGCGWQITLSNVLSIRCFNGHTFKNRMQNSNISHCRFADTERGQASNILDLPDGGAHTIMNSVLHQGTQTQNGACLEFSEDMQYYDNIQAFSIDSSSNTYISNSFKNFGTTAIAGNGMTSKSTGAYTTITSTNDGYIGFNTNIGFQNWYWQEGQGTIGFSRSFPVPVITSGLVNLSSQPALDLTTPITPAITSRPGPYLIPYDGDGEQQYVGELYLGGGGNQGVPTGMGQVDCGSDDLHISASGSPVGAKVCTMTATGCPYFMQNPTQPDIRINPYGSGTTWSLLTNAKSYTVGSFPVAPAGTFLINGTTGDITVGQPLTAGTTYLIIPQAQASSANGGYFCWDIVYVVVRA